MTPIPVTYYEKDKATALDYSTSSPLLSIMDEMWTIGDACEGVQIFGGTGSGKTSGSGQMLAKTYLYNGFGGLVLTVKAGDSQMWTQYCKDLKREDDLMIVNESEEYKFNFLQYLVQEGYSTSNITHTFLCALQKYNSGDYWQNAMEQLIKNTVNLLIMGTGTVSIQEMYKVVTSGAKSLEEADLVFAKESAIGSMEIKNKQTGSTQTIKPYFRDLFAAAQSKSSELKSALAKSMSIKNKKLVLEFEELTTIYWQQEFPAMNPKTRSSVISMFTSLADSLIRGDLRSILSCDPGEMNFFPEDAFKSQYRNSI